MELFLMSLGAWAIRWSLVGREDCLAGLEEDLWGLLNPVGCSVEPTLCSERGGLTTTS